MRRKCNEKSLMLNTVVPVKGVVCLVPVCTQTVSRFFVVELGKQIGQLRQLLQQNNPVYNEGKYPAD